jgi:hypothetical protein
MQNGSHEVNQKRVIQECIPASIELRIRGIDHAEVRWLESR